MNHETDVSSCPPASKDGRNLDTVADADAEVRSGQLPSKQLVVREEIQVSISPIPTAEELGKYESVAAGTANRILGMTENQAKHRQQIEWEETRANTASKKRQQWFGFIFAMTALIAGTYLMSIGARIWGSAIVIGPWLFRMIEYFWDKFRHWQTRRAASDRVPRPHPPRKPGNTA